MYHHCWEHWTSDGAIPWRLFVILSNDLHWVLGLERLNAAHASVKAQAIVSSENRGKNLIQQMIRESGP